MESLWEDKEFAKLRLRNSIDRKSFPGTEQEVGVLLRELELRKGNSMIDLGCGAGWHAIEMAKRGIRVV